MKSKKMKNSKMNEKMRSTDERGPVAY